MQLKKRAFIGGYARQKPCGPLKSGKPLSHPIPAPAWMSNASAFRKAATAGASQDDAAAVLVDAIPDAGRLTRYEKLRYFAGRQQTGNALAKGAPCVQNDPSVEIVWQES